MNRLWNILIAFDQLGKTIIYGGNPDVTISHEIGVRIRENRANKVEIFIAKVLNKIDKNHTSKSIEEDEI
ncbi:hypothetical protein [Arcobacter arenosus]|uniref:Uncharacterized protein n=1 Tax=Arcobacter arenosus TaxID=2576037 RepID=A0A5R8Y4X5_9BACT|nr:hypothetical protein [Arcobacter arenosus]TLP41028.1 hypothetical protein FDK22_03140 [Arcobacter arenosus]